MPVSEAQKRASEKYRAKTYDRIIIELRKDNNELEQWKQAAAACGSSLSGFIKKATRARIAAMIAEGAQIETPEKIADRLAAEKAETEKQPDKIDADARRHKYITD